MKTSMISVMRTHPLIRKAIKEAKTAGEKAAAMAADEADKVERSYHGHNSGFVNTRSHMIDSAHADLLKAGLVQINKMPIDVWLLRFTREWDKLR